MQSALPNLNSAEKQRSGLLYTLGKLPIVHRAVAFLRIYPLVNFVLSKVNLTRKFEPGEEGLTIRIRSVAALTLAEEIFSNESYRSALEGSEVNSFVDLGCNIGWFAVYLAKLSQKRQFSGILIDANPDTVEEARWHLQRNRFEHCEALLGAVGFEGGIEEVTFHINPSDTQSSLTAFGEDHPFPVKGKVRSITVPALVLEKEWTRRFGQLPIDVLKIDIEGAELVFLKSEIQFIQTRVHKIICEWHKWHLSFEELNEYLLANGFLLKGIVEEDPRSGVAVYQNSSL